MADAFGWLAPVDVEAHRVPFPEEGASHQTVELGQRDGSSAAEEARGGEEEEEAAEEAEA